MENTAFVLQQTRETLESTIKATIIASFKSLSLLSDSLIEQAKHDTKTREEYISYLKGAAFLFYRVCNREDRNLEKNTSGISTPQDAINHCYDLLPFMTESEKEEHIKLMKWLNELIQRRGDKKIVFNDLKI